MNVRDSANDNEAVTLNERIEKLEYVEQMLRELRQIASGVDAATLTYLLEMATIEAKDTIEAARKAGGLLAR